VSLAIDEAVQAVLQEHLTEEQQCFMARYYESLRAVQTPPDIDPLQITPPEIHQEPTIRKGIGI
jgi:hypothetical protein